MLELQNRQQTATACHLMLVRLARAVPSPLFMQCHTFADAMLEALVWEA